MARRLQAGLTASTGRRSRIRRLLAGTASWIGIIVIPLALLDLLCMGLGLFPPVYHRGDPELGWLPLTPGKLHLDSCVNSKGELIEYYRNEIGARTDRSMAQITARPGAFLIAAVGDSHSDICAPNEQTHQGVLEARLNANGVDALVLSLGVGRYSPLQSYLLFEKRLKGYKPDALVLNFYTGNDFNDMLRTDDRPHFVPRGQGYTIHPPDWYRYDDPAVQYRSRLLFVYKSLLARTGIRNFLQRVRLLYGMATDQGEGLGTVLAYLNDLRRSVEPSIGYEGAFAAQILNQQLFFHHFPGSRAESLRRLRALMAMVRERNPEILLVMSPLPSYQLARRVEPESPFRAVLDRLPLSLEEGEREEEELYGDLRELAAELGWLFIDNLTPLRTYDGREPLYNDFDYHLTPIASAIVGDTEATALAAYLSHQAPPSGRRPDRAAAAGSRPVEGAAGGRR